MAEKSTAVPIDNNTCWGYPPANCSITRKLNTRIARLREPISKPAHIIQGNHGRDWIIDKLWILPIRWVENIQSTPPTTMLGRSDCHLLTKRTMPKKARNKWITIVIFKAIAGLNKKKNAVVGYKIDWLISPIQGMPEKIVGFQSGSTPLSSHSTVKSLPGIMSE